MRRCEEDSARTSKIRGWDAVSVSNSSALARTPLSHGGNLSIGPKKNPQEILGEEDTLEVRAHGEKLIT
jgi:hypothetical protein